MKFVDKTSFFLPYELYIYHKRYCFLESGLDIFPGMKIFVMDPMI